MKLEPAQRRHVKIKAGLQGPSGSGKTMSALLLAFGLCESWERVAVIDTENRSADLYAHLGPYQVLPLTPPFSPERYSQAVQVCLQAGVDVIILDSITHEWEFILDAHSSLTGNSYTNWSKFTPRHQQFIQTLLQADVHILCTIRSKQDYVLTEKNGKQVPEKVGLKPIQREGTDYELTVVFELDIRHRAVATKDRTGLFISQPEVIITEGVGRQIREWCNGPTPEPVVPVAERIGRCATLGELLDLYKSLLPEHQQTHLENFTNRKNTLSQSATQPLVSPQNQFTNGLHP